MAGGALKVAIGSSGLGHVRRGVETWALDLARTLVGSGAYVRLFQGAVEGGEEWRQSVPCWRRHDARAGTSVRWSRRFGGWRWGFGSPYQAEQTTFAFGLWRRIRSTFDIVHVQDPWVALILDRLHRRRLSRPRVILAHGTEEPEDTLRKYSVLQHLAPCYLERLPRVPGQQVFAIPNFVDTHRFCPGNRADARQRWGLGERDLVVLCVAAIKATHKRVDALIRETRACVDGCNSPVTLVVAGAREAETDRVIRTGQEVLGDRVRFLENVSHEEIASLYQAADLFALASLHEMMPIAVLEALATGIPVACNDTPVLRWMVGDAGQLQDIGREGALGEQLLRLRDPDVRRRLGGAARARAVSTFSAGVVVSQILAMYEAVAGADRSRGAGI